MKTSTLVKSLIACALLPVASFAQCKNTQTIDLFNGKDLSNWNLYLDSNETTKPEKVFKVSNGVIHIKGNPFGYIYTKEKYSNFKLHVEWQYPIEKTNSGIFLFVQEPGPHLWPKGIECQLCAGSAGDFVLLGGSEMEEFKLPEGAQRPQFPVVGKKAPSNEAPVGQWNTADITCKNGEIIVYINGTLQNVGHTNLKDGYIALQSEGSDILFRNVRITPLK